MEWAAATGGAALVSPDGRVALAKGSVDVDLAHVAHMARRLDAARHDVSFRTRDVCVLAGPVGHGWALCIVSTPDVVPAATTERLHKAARLLALALADVPPPRGSGTPQGPSHAALVMASSKRRA